MAATEYTLRAIGRVHSQLKALEDAPRQGSEGAPGASLEIDIVDIKPVWVSADH